MSQDPVRTQYEAYPYPVREPADERKRLITGSPSHVDELNHYVFGGKLDPERPFRALIAGGGTGDAAIMLAQQLADRCPLGDVLYIDISEHSRRIAEERARVRGLRNIRFMHLSITDLAASAEAAFEAGPFDYIDCCGVLHHLDDPAAGLRTLTGVLADAGGMGLMVYGEYGRTGVYQMQDMLRLLEEQEPGRAPTDRVDLARRLLNQLPATNWLHRNPFIRDHLEQGDAGLYDLFLHARDRPFRVPEISDLAKAAGLRIIAFVEPAFYDPRTYLPDGCDAGLAAALGRLSWLQRCAFAELLAGNMRKHVFYAVKEANPISPPNPADPDAVPVLRDLDGKAFADRCRPGAALTADQDGTRLRRPLPSLTAPILRRIDGRRSVNAIYADLADDDASVDRAIFSRQWTALFEALNGIGKLYLASPRPDSPPPASPCPASPHSASPRP
jgi:SAM-dependent methyltransferase